MGEHRLKGLLLLIMSLLCSSSMVILLLYVFRENVSIISAIDAIIKAKYKKNNVNQRI